MRGPRHECSATALLLRMLLLCIGITTSALSHGASWESLVMPGPVIEAHAETEQECSACHAAFSRENQPQLCLECHEDVAADLAGQAGYHGRNPAIAGSDCSSCHSEHLGREADVSGLVPETFRHDLTDFELTGAHDLQPCSACHVSGEKHRDAPSGCADCHEEDDAHESNLGSDCAQCHTPEAWRKATFDHERETSFALLGAHASQTCSSCHIDQVFKSTSSECVDCHQADDMHGGERGDACADCHRPQAWDDTRFDHAANTGFALEAAHADLVCSACHLTGMSLKEPPTDCAGCHSSNDVHQGQRGSDCAQCHNSRSWRIEFDHEAEAGFALLGKHSDLNCESCHVGALSDPLPTSCEECHAEDDPHSGTLGACDSCHQADGWLERVRFDHEFTRFPLVGLHRLATCDQCHLSRTFEEPENECAACHAHNDPHGGSFGESCQRCHTPGGWELWAFDHDAGTDFALTGSHVDLACASCHDGTRGTAPHTSSKCSSCHLNDDVHHGQFGARCERCHTTTSFADSVSFR